MYPMMPPMKPTVKECSTCAFWEGSESAYRADCTLRMLTRPEAWQTCPKWAVRKPEQDQSETRG